jgi:hypothetical protein
MKNLWKLLDKSGWMLSVGDVRTSSKDNWVYHWLITTGRLHLFRHRLGARNKDEFEAFTIDTEERALKVDIRGI